jgi:putative hydrolase of the HAD superfamily
LPLRAVLFDAAGTLIEPREPIGGTYLRFMPESSASEDRLQEAFRAALRAMEPMVFPGRSRQETVAMERNWWRRVVGETFRLAGGPVGEGDFEEGFAALFAHYARPQAWRAVPRAFETLSGLRSRGLLTGIVSNFDRRLPPILAGLGIADLLDVVALPSDVGVAKPDGRIFAFALARLAVTPREALHVGDDPVEDIAGARAAGMAAVDVADLENLDDVIEIAARA